AMTSRVRCAPVCGACCSIAAIRQRRAPANSVSPSYGRCTSCRRCSSDNSIMPVSYRDLTSLEEFAQVVELERVIWGPDYDEVVPVPILAVTVKRGGILIGGFDADRMIAFVYSLPGIKDSS